MTLDKTPFPFQVVNKTVLISLIVALFYILTGCGQVSKASYTPTTSAIYPSTLVVNQSNIKTEDNQLFMIQGIALPNGVYTKTTIQSAKDSGYLLGLNDYINIKEMGLNTVRFYLQYNWLDNDSEIDSFTSILDEQIELARSQGLYIILSLHYFGVSPGGFYNGSGGYDCVSFWQRIVTRYKDNKIISGYDILNEPKVSDTFTEQQLYLLYDSIINAIRSSNDAHIIFVSDPVNKFDDVEYSNDKSQALQSYYLNSDAFQLINSDNNIVYEYHWYKPSEFTHQCFPYNDYFELGATYPYLKNNEQYQGGWYSDSQIGNTNDLWVKYSGQWVDASSLKSASATHFGICLLFGGSDGQIWFDNITINYRLKSDHSVVNQLSLKNHNIKWPTRYLNGNINTPSDMPANWSTSVHPSNSSDVVFRYDPQVSYLADNSGSLNSDTQTTSWVAGSYAAWKSAEGRNGQVFEIDSNYEYQIVFMTKSTGLSSSKISAGFEWYTVNPVDYNAAYIQNAIQSYYQQWGQQKLAPIYCGEFGVANPGQSISGYPNSPGEQVQWINNIKTILNNAGHHWTYHDYKDFSTLGFGLFDSDANIMLRQAVQNN